MPIQKNGLKADRGRSYREIERIAARWRQELGYAPLAAFDARQFFEFEVANLKLATRDGEIDVLNHVQPCSEEGLTLWNTDDSQLELILSEVSYRDLQDGMSRPRFTVCHEFGHAVLHTDELVRLAGLSIERQAAMYREREHSKCYDSEWQANAFAAAILMPAEGVSLLESKYGYVSEDLVADQFLTSILAARYRLESMTKV
jgi:hypothetical protein